MILRPFRHGRGSADSNKARQREAALRRPGLAKPKLIDTLRVHGPFNLQLHAAAQTVESSSLVAITPRWASGEGTPCNQVSGRHAARASKQGLTGAVKSLVMRTSCRCAADHTRTMRDAEGLLCQKRPVTQMDHRCSTAHFRSRSRLHLLRSWSLRQTRGGSSQGVQRVRYASRKGSQHHRSVPIGCRRARRRRRDRARSGPVSTRVQAHFPLVHTVLPACPRPEGADHAWSRRLQTSAEPEPHRSPPC
jgi:hypothetical protein